MKSFIALATKIRIIPAVIIATSLLLVIKASNLALSFSQSAFIPVYASTQNETENLDNQKQHQILLKLHERRKKLEADEQKLILQKKLNQVTEERINQKIKKLEKITKKLNQIYTKKNQEQINKIKKLAQIYEKMKPKDAAKIFNILNIEIIKEVAKYIKADSISKILAKMKVEIAQRLTTEIVRASIEKNTKQTQKLPKITN